MYFTDTIFRFLGENLRKGSVSIHVYQEHRTLNIRHCRRNSYTYRFNNNIFLQNIYYFRYVWAICLVAINILCCILIYQLVFMFWEMPAIISLDNSVSSIWTIPFPAVTVCSTNRVRPSVYNYADINNSTDYDDQYIYYIIIHFLNEY